MKKLMLLLLLAILTAGGLLHAAEKDVILIKYIFIEYGEGDGHNHSVHGNRLPQYEVPCSIDPSTGINLKGEGQIDILLYEIWNINGGCISSFDSEEDFLEILFKLSGEYEIHLNTDNCTYIGIISI